MSAPLFMGIDGGGSRLRIVITDCQLHPLASLQESAANPNIIGHSAAQAHIRRGIGAALQMAGETAQAISAVTIGIAGASNTHSERWLLETVAPALPQSQRIASSDLEIALVGALGQRHGILLLAGTGSAVYGRAPAGPALQIGGWGYLLGDAGSSYWIGARLLRCITEEYDAGATSALAQRCLAALCLAQPRDLIAWLYRSQEPPAPRLASLAPLVLEMAANGSAPAKTILQAAALRLVEKVQLMQRRLAYPTAPIAFAGGLIEQANYFSEEVARRLELPEVPRPKYAPVLGAALLAKMQWSATNR